MSCCQAGIIVAAPAGEGAMDRQRFGVMPTGARGKPRTEPGPGYRPHQHRARL
jgi:hypothetical protein